MTVSFDLLEGRVLGKALACAIAVIDILPEPIPEREAADRNDMVHCLCLMVPDETEREGVAAEAERLVGRLPDLTDWSLAE